MSAATQTERAVSAWAELAYTYFERIAAGDTVRAQLVLNEMVRVLTDFRTDIVANATGRGVTASTIPTTPITTAAQTQRMLQLALVLGWGDRVRTVVSSMPTTPAAVSAWFASLRSSVGTPPTITSWIAAQPVAGLAGNLAGMVNEQIYEIRVGMPTPTPAPAPAPPPAPTSTTRVLPPIDVYGRTGQWQMPTWGWWALGLGGVAALGYMGWRIYEAP